MKGWVQEPGPAAKPKLDTEKSRKAVTGTLLASCDATHGIDQPASYRQQALGAVVKQHVASYVHPESP